MNNYDVIIIGGSYAGLSAAMALGRASRSTLIIDSGMPCNRQTPHSHNFITHDGKTPAAIAEEARQQVLLYPTVSLLNDKAITATRNDKGFTVTTQEGKEFKGRKLLLTTGVYDIMPAIPGFAECWGISVIHCPYCHGYEVKGEKTAILANGDAAYHYASLLQQWTKDLTIFTNGTAVFNPEQQAKLTQHNIEVIEENVSELIHKDGQLQEIVLQNGKRYTFKVMYSRPLFRQHTDIPLQIGCNIDEAGYIATDFLQKTSVPSVYAAGDCTSPLRAVATAVAAGMKAGAAINNELATEDF